MIAIAVDLYNQVITEGGVVTMTLSNARSDPHHIPCVVIIDDEDSDNAE